MIKNLDMKTEKICPKSVVIVLIISLLVSIIPFSCVFAYDEGTNLFTEDFENSTGWTAPADGYTSEIKTLPAPTPTPSPMPSPAPAPLVTGHNQTETKVMRLVQAGATGGETTMYKALPATYTGDLVFEYWVYPNDAGKSSHAGIILYNATLTQFLSLILWGDGSDANGVPRVLKYNNVAIPNSRDFILPLQWNNIKIILKPTTTDIYINGNKILTDQTYSATYTGLARIGLNTYKYHSDNYYDDITISKPNIVTPTFTTSAWNSTTTKINSNVSFVNNGENKNVLAVLELYDADNTMVGHVENTVAIAKGDTAIKNIALEIPNVVGAVKARTYVWEGTSSLDTTAIPYCNFIELTKSAQ